MLLANTLKKIQTLRHCLGIDLSVNSDKIESWYFKQSEATSILNDIPLELVDQFLYIDLKQFKIYKKRC